MDLHCKMAEFSNKNPEELKPSLQPAERRDLRRTISVHDLLVRAGQLCVVLGSSPRSASSADLDKQDALNYKRRGWALRRSTSERHQKNTKMSTVALVEPDGSNRELWLLLRCPEATCTLASVGLQVPCWSVTCVGAAALGGPVTLRITSRVHATVS